MICSDLPSPAEAGFAKAGNRFPPRIKSGAGFFRIMPYCGFASAPMRASGRGNGSGTLANAGGSLTSHRHMR